MEMEMDMPTHDPLDERPDEKARRIRTPREAVEEMESILENETTPTDDLPPLHEDYGGIPDEPEDTGARRS
jgi:hypothetical protein